MRATPPPPDDGAHTDARGDPDYSGAGFDSGGQADLFDDAYYRLLAPFHSEADARRETAAVRELLGLAQSDRLLDLACGWGRHARLLLEAGHDVVGVDASLALLRRAQEVAVGADPLAGRPEDGALESGAGESRAAGSRPAETGAAGTGAPLLVAGVMGALPFTAGAFDAVINVASPIGLFLQDATAVEALQESWRVLRPGGSLLVEAMHRDDVEVDFAPRDAWTLADGTEVSVRRRWDTERGISHEVLWWEGPWGSGTKHHSLRVRTAQELAALLTGAGFAVSTTYGDWNGEPFERTSPRWIGVASRK